MAISKLKILQDQVSSCTKCELHKTRTQTVFSRGNAQAPLCIVGEAGGEEEDKTGFPFVGRSGKLLDKTLTELGLDVSTDIYVCNIIKCRPPGNRKPTNDEVNTCIDYLEEQLKLVSPKVIVALGSTAASGLLPFDYAMSKIRGKFYKRNKIAVIPTWHPSFVLRNGGSGPVFDEFKADLQLAINKTREVS